MEFTEQEFDRFIETHASDDTARLRMKYHGNRGYTEAINQIELRRKSPEKFIVNGNESVRPRLLHSALAIEQSTSATVARYHASLIKHGCNLLDMTMGMGIDATTFATVAGCHVTAIERQTELYETSRRNFSSIGNLTIINADSVEWLNESDQIFDVIFIDPARRDNAGKRVFNIHDCTPDIDKIMPLVLKHTDKVMIKLSPMLDVTATLRDIPLATEIHIVEERGDCRELLVVIDKSHTEEAGIVISDGSERFRFKRTEELSADVRFGNPRCGDFLYEPSPAAMKAGPFRLLSERFGVTALAPNSHLYFSSTPVAGFPGKEYTVEEILPYSSSVLKRFSNRFPRVSVAVRNFPESADKLRSRLKVKESDTMRLVATTSADSGKMLLLLKHSGH